MRPSKIATFGGTLIIALVLFCLTAAAQSRERVLHVFTYSPSCDSPSAPLTADAAGNLYGSTFVGGTTKMGCIFELSPTATGWQETTLYSFNGFSSGDGAYPAAALTFDSQGNLYGTTERGGAYDAGVAFELSPTNGGGWTETVLHNFGSGSNGNGPQSDLIFDRAGNLYGTTTGSGGNRRGGTVFKLTPGLGGWTETILYAFPTSGPDGDWPAGGVVMDGAGNLYGATHFGGAGGYGSVYRLAILKDGSYREGHPQLQPVRRMGAKDRLDHRRQRNPVRDDRRGRRHDCLLLWGGLRTDEKLQWKVDGKRLAFDGRYRWWLSDGPGGFRRRRKSLCRRPIGRHVCPGDDLHAHAHLDRTVERNHPSPVRLPVSGRQRWLISLRGRDREARAGFRNYRRWRGAGRLRHRV
jgi:uncharacterized repeat protein (TIGR03803 family)